MQVRAAAGIGSGLSLLQTSTPLQRNGNFCKNPTKPVPLRRLPSSSSDLVVELVVSEMPFAACTRPEQLDLPQVRMGHTEARLHYGIRMAFGLG